MAAGVRHLEDLSPATWLLDSDTDPERLITFGPAVFEAYARLRFIPDPAGPGLAEADAQVADDHPDELTQARVVLSALARATSTPDAAFFCVWEGYTGSSLDPVLTRGPLVTLPHRRYVLFAGALAGFAGWEDQFGGGRPPAFVWPGGSPLVLRQRRRPPLGRDRRRRCGHRLADRPDRRRRRPRPTRPGPAPLRPMSSAHSTTHHADRGVERGPSARAAAGSDPSRFA